MSETAIATIVGISAISFIILLIVFHEKWIPFITGEPVTKEEVKEWADFFGQIKSVADEVEIENVRRRVDKQKRIKEIESELESSSGDALDKRIDSLIKKSKK